MDNPVLRLKPFLKWPGGKRAHVDMIVSAISTLPGFKTYYEPFAGGACLFFRLSPPRAVLSDVNSDLVLTYRQVQKNVQNVIRHLRVMKNSKFHYYIIRASHPLSPAHQAARFIYLSRMCWNGLYRVNVRGEFNVPYAGYRGRTILDIKQLRAASQALAYVRVRRADFEDALADSGAKDLIYLDPPYVSPHANNGFIKYNSRLFSWLDQERLARVFKRLSRRGAYVILTNLDHPKIRNLYRGFKLRILTRTSVIAADPNSRRPVRELLISNF